MAQFFPLTVTEIDRSARDAVVVSLEPPEESRSEFGYKHGQYLTFRRAFDGQELRRSYSICSSVSDNRLRVGIRKVVGGSFSSWANEELEVGDQIESMPPAGEFTFPLDADRAGSYLGIAAGSGITPVLSIIKTILETESGSSATLLFANRSVATIMFREEIEDLKNRYMARFAVLHILSSGSDVDLTSGRLDEAKYDTLFGRLIDVRNLDRAFVCGPRELTMMVCDKLESAGMDRRGICFELFGVAQPGRMKRRSVAEGSKSVEAVCEVRIILDGVCHAVEIRDSDTSVLDAALEGNIGAPFSCRSGVCSTCRARVVEGDYEFVTNHALEDYEVEQGFVLSCQCFPTGGKLVIDYDR